jgi:protein O-mannosyl-transferase
MNRLVRFLCAPMLHALILIVAAFAVYSNNYRHDYQLDSGHLLLENSAVRSLRNIPSYFRDPSTLSSLRSNIDYRPVLQVTYAINYAISKYDTWSWHLVQILLHCICALGLSAFCVILMKQFGYPTAASRWTSFIAALIFVLHPAASGVVNYLSARSSLLTAAFLLPALCAYMKPREDRRYSAAPAVAAGLYCLALFTKVEAIGALPVFFLYDMLQTARKRSGEGGRGGPVRDFLRTFNRTTFVRMIPLVAVTAIYCAIRWTVMNGYDTGARHDAAVTPLVYFLTQTTAWWHYVRIWFAPVNLIADDMCYPVFRSITDPQVLLAVGGWLAAAYAVVAAYPRSPHLFFLAASALCLIAPTSSFAPLAEMVNEHRPYLPVAVLSCAWLIPSLPAVFSLAKRNRGAAFLALLSGAVIFSSLSLLTRQRNLAFKSERSYYEDILKKAPSARAYANYGLIFLKEGLYREALEYYLQAQRLAPNWHIVHINLGLIYQALGNDSLANACFNFGVAVDQYSGTAKVYRGEYLLAKHHYNEALADFRDVLPLHRQKYALRKGAATAAAGLGYGETSVRYARQCFEEDPGRFENDVTTISRPFWDRPELCGPGRRFFAAIDSLLPGRWWVHYNLGDLSLRCSDTSRARVEFDRAGILKNGQNGPSPLRTGP